MIEHNLFPTKVYMMMCDFDLENLKQEVYEHAGKEKSVNVSNVGGYQGHRYYNEDLFHTVAKNLPQVDSKPLKEITSNMWININKKGDYNGIHDHSPYEGTALSGVFYVQVPENSGKIKLYDPRQFITSAPDMVYYNDRNTYHFFDPMPNMLIIFPAWLKHEVEPNQSDEDRISIAFNIKLIY